MLQDSRSDFIWADPIEASRAFGLLWIASALTEVSDKVKEEDRDCDARDTAGMVAVFEWQKRIFSRCHKKVFLSGKH
ncbi:hypothetical protein J6590_097609 [Homalodisca vitripennis]|nr:hypothetical protein J6590_097609 [Homalodisca vitripennis]